MNQPMVSGYSRLFWALATARQITRSACFVGNVCQTQPPYDKIESLTFNSTEIQAGLAALRQDLAIAKPNCILLLGNLPLRAAGIEHKASDYRGTVFMCRDTSSPFYGYKCISTLRPKDVLRDPSTAPLLDFDIGRAVLQSTTPSYAPPVRILDVELTAAQICARLDEIVDGTLTSIDIEGGIQQGITCVGVSTNPACAFIVNPHDFTIDEQLRIFKSLARVLGRKEIPKVLQNSLYDNFCLTWLWKTPIKNVAFDTMLSGWEILPELPKSLSVQTSIWTDEPYYKFQRTISDKLTHFRYCCTDACVTLELAQKHSHSFTPAASKHFRFNMELLPALHYMELRGIKYAKDRAIHRLEEIRCEMAEIKARFDTSAQMLYQQRTAQIEKFDINPNCSAGKNALTLNLYRKLGFEPQYKKEHGRKTTATTADVEALLTLAKSTSSPIIRDILNWRVLEGQRKQLEIGTDLDGRIRCGYNLVGTETGRLTCYESPTGSGTNLQTIMKKNRDLFVADDDHYFFQCDLAGADGWTVAAWCSFLGDETMMLDYMAGIKPARVVAAMYYHGYSVASLKQDDLKEIISKTKIDAGLYFTCKRVQHGSNYMMGKNTMSSVILKDFWKVNGEINYVPPKQCEALQNLYLRGRYRGVTRWQEHIKKQLERTRTLDCASGHVRTFFGRPSDLETIKAALSHEPQANTTYATNLAIHRLWHDPENRTSDGRLIIEPLHQVHDAVCGQFPKAQVDWAIKKIRSYFDNPLRIASSTLTIPFEGAYGSSWGDLENPI